MFFNTNDLVFFPIHGVTYDDESGGAVSYAGDVNGDGIDDVIIGAKKAEFGVQPAGNSSGESYVVFGRATDTKMELSNLDTNTGNHGFIIRGIHPGNFSGASVSAAGDVNGDGLDDIIIGAYGAGDSGVNVRGESYVVFGKTSTTEVNLSHIRSNTGGHGFLIRGSKSYDQSGFSVSGAGDVNGDGLDDIIIGAPLADPTYLIDDGQASAGLSYVVYGKTTSTPVRLSDVEGYSGSHGFAIHGASVDDRSGISVSGAGDVNGDCFDDVIIGAKDADPNGTSNKGSSYVVFGKSTASASTVGLSNIESNSGYHGFAIYGSRYLDYSGSAVSKAGDMNKDGLGDVIVGSPMADPRRNSGRENAAGISYVIFGKATTTPVQLTD